MSKAKHKQGKQICSIKHFEDSQCTWFKWNGKTVHRSVLISLQYRILHDTIMNGRLYEADPIEDGRDLTQLNKLEQYLKDNNIPYERIDKDDGVMDWHQICVPNHTTQEKEWDVICHKGSYGSEEGLLELYGTIGDPNAEDSVEGWLTADDVIARIRGEEDERENY